MKRIKSVNGYTIYLANEHDEEMRNNITSGYYYIYPSSDIKEYGLVMIGDEPTMKLGTLEQAIDWCSNDDYAIAKQSLESKSTFVTFDDIEKEQKN